MRHYFTRLTSIAFVNIRGMASQAIQQKQKVDFTKLDVKNIIPPLSAERHKGEAGRIGVIGGSREYTGAPYFSAMAALRLGADIAHIFCTESAGVAIKAYSPDVIVHPILNDEDFLDQLVNTWLPRLHALVIGPGLGRDKSVVDAVRMLISKPDVFNEGIPIIFDADGLHVLLQRWDIIGSLDNLIITPNAIEYKRFVQHLTNVYPQLKDDDDEGCLTNMFPKLTVVRKGSTDVISKGSLFCEVSGSGSLCRCGGQGDVLSGSIALFSYWARLAGVENSTLLGAYSGCYFTRLLSETVFEEKGRSMATNDFFDKIGTVYNKINNV